MLDLTFKLEGYDTVASLISNAQRGMLTKTKYALARAGPAWARVIRQNCPVDTGALKKSVGWELSNGGLTVSAGANMDGSAYYAPYVEYGHHTAGGGWVPGQYFLFRSAKEVMPQVQALFEKQGL